MKSSETEIKRLSLFLDTSGQPDVDEWVAITGIWCETEHVEELGNFMQRLRNMNGSQNSIHFNAIGSMKSCGGKAHLANDWIKAALYDTFFSMRARTLLVDCRDFEMKWYGNSRNIAINRLVKTYVLGCLGLYCDKSDVVDLNIYVDGHAKHYEKGTGLIDYLSETIDFNSRKRAHQPTVLSADVIAVPRKPLDVSGSQRQLQDLTALADVIAGATRFNASPYETTSAKPQLAMTISSGMKKLRYEPEQLRAVTATLYVPPSTFELIVPYEVKSLISN